MSTTLARADTGARISGMRIVFQAGRNTCVAVTNSMGAARCNDPSALVAALITGRYTVGFAGTSVYAPSRTAASLHTTQTTTWRATTYAKAWFD